MAKRKEFDYDTIIIGSGIGGLITGAFLAEAGVKVLICEQHRQPGGCFTSFKRKGYTFDGGIQGFEDAGVFLSLFRRFGLLERLRFKKSHFAVAFPDFFLRLESVADVGAFYRALKKFYPHESDGIERITRDAQACCDFMFAFQKMPNAIFTPWKEALMALPGWYRAHSAAVKYGPEFFRNLTIVMEDYFKQHISDPDLYRFLSQLSYSGSPASFGLLFLTFLMDYYHPMGGIQVVPNALADYITEHGGQMKYRTLVEEILMQGDKAQGIRTQNGEIYRAPFIISNGDARRTYLKMLPPDAVPDFYKQELRQSRVSESFFTLFLGVDIPPEEIPTRGCSHLLFFPDCKGVDSEALKSSGDVDVYSRSPVDINVNSIHDPALAPKGKSAIVIQTGASAEFADNWGTKNGKRTKEYRALKEKVEDRLIATVENVIPGLSRRIEVKFSGTPYTFERYTLNSEGASAGWTFHPQKAMNSGLKFFTGFNPPVRNLFQVGHWAMSPGGAPSGAITGRIVSEIVKRRLEWGI
jgi:phytoene dehydrogenase-like protein